MSDQTYKSEKIEIIVVSNEPKICTPKDIRLPNNAIVINELKKGSYSARNTGIKQSNGSIIAFTDSDCIPDKNWIENAVKLIKNKDRIIVGGQIKIIKDDIKKNIYTVNDDLFSFKQDRYVKEGFTVTANFITRKDTFETVGLFNSSMLSGGDREFCSRAIKKGFTIEYKKDVLIYHPPRMTYGELLSKELRIARGVAVKKNKIYSIITAVLYLRPKINNIVIIIKSNIRNKKKIKLILIKYYIQIQCVKERLKVIIENSKT